MKWLAISVPLRPRTPQANGSSSGISPLPLKVVMTGQLSVRASWRIGTMWKRAPWPTMMAGRFAERSRSRALSVDRRGGVMSNGVSLPSGPEGRTSAATGWVWTSFGRIRWPTSRLSIACLSARVISSAGRLVESTVWLQAATDWNAEARSTSWNAPGPRTCVSTCPVRARIGTRSMRASHSPVRRLVAPGPAMLKHAAGSPVSLAKADAAKEAAPSWRTPT